jgi:hypothetical protein
MTSGSRTQTVWCIMIGNRSEKHDSDLVKEWGANTDKQHRTEYVRARLPAVHMRSWCAQRGQSTDVQELVHWWLAASRMLWGDEILTFRFMDSVLIDVMKPTREVALGDILDSKMPQIGKLTCERCTSFMLQLHARYSERLKLQPSIENVDERVPPEALASLANETDSDPFALLARTAVLAALASSRG